MLQDELYELLKKKYIEDGTKYDFKYVMSKFEGLLSKKEIDDAYYDFCFALNGLRKIWEEPLDIWGDDETD
ncbi:hypothetical protein [Bacillus pinisoli]|uniref:hypothetical protein n=1 Tax=Bacillus pinisoli TaxID=2901866 RepID=UPI001FF3AA5D|nr:hypothetical protein [Bacillus pinisoli]